MKAKITSNLLSIRTVMAPELARTPNGISVCKFKTIIDEGIGDKTTPVSYRVTLWRDKAEFFFALSQQWRNKDGKVGVGMQLNVYSNQPFSTYAFVRKDPQTKKPMYTQDGDPLCDAIIEVTAYDFDVLSELPENAYKTAAAQVKAGLQPSERQPRDTAPAGRYVEDTSDIPF